MDEDRNLLSDILHHLAPLFPLSPYIYVRPGDNIIETNAGGFFRVAFSPSTGTTALFAADHPENLAAIEEPETRAAANGEDPTPLQILHKDRLILAGMYQPHHSEEAFWHSADRRRQFDVSWVGAIIPERMRAVHRASRRERILQLCLDPPSYGSAFVRYLDVARGERTKPVRVITKTDHNFAWPQMPAERRKLRGNMARRLFRRASRALLERYPAMPLLDRHGNVVPNDCPPHLLKEHILHDFHHKHGRIISGHDPLTWLEKPSLPLFRATGVLESSLDHLREEFSFSEIEHNARRAGMIGLYAVFFGGAILHVVLRTCIHWAGEFGVKEKMLNVPDIWMRILSGYSRRLHSVDSALHKLLVRPHPGAFGDFEWINPQCHACSFAAGPAQENPAAPELHPGHTFRLWLGHHFLAPPCVALSDCVGKRGIKVDPGSPREILFWQQQSYDGMMSFYVPRTGMLYSYYHKPGYVPDVKLPEEAAEYLKPGRVLSRNLHAPRGPLQSQSFEQFQNELFMLTGARSLDLPAAGAPGPEAFYSTEADGGKPEKPLIEEPAAPAAACPGRDYARHIATWPSMMM